MANRPIIGTGISNNLSCVSCDGTDCSSSVGACWQRTNNLGSPGPECKCFPEPGPTAGDGQPGEYPGWSGWKRKTSTQSTNTISISTTDGVIQVVEVERIAEIRYMDENDNVNSIPFPGYRKAQEITNYVMDVNNIVSPPSIGLIPSSPVAFQRKPRQYPAEFCTCTSPLKVGCCGQDECWLMNGYGNKNGFMCQRPGIKFWPNEESSAQLDKALRSTTKSGLSYRTIIGAYSCGTQEAQACTNVCGHFEMGCCLPSGTDPCPKWNSKLSTCYHIGLWSADNGLIGKTYVCASSPAEALYIDCPTCSTTGGGGSTTIGQDNTSKCVQSIRNGKPIKVCTPLTNPGQQGKQ